VLQGCQASGLWQDRIPWCVATAYDEGPAGKNLSAIKFR
jgi:hypothetical protein